VVATHPIQYQTPLYRYLTERDLPVHVFFLCRRGYDGGHDVGFGRAVSWDIPLVEGFSHEFVPGVGRTPERFFGLLNPTLLSAIDGRRFSAVLVHGWRSLSMLSAIARARTARLPVFYRAESTSLSTSVRGKTAEALTWGMKNMVSACLSIGSLNDAFYSAVGVPPDRRFLVPYAVDNARFQAAAVAVPKAQARAALGISGAGPVVLFAGKLVAWKRPELLLRAFIAAAPRDAQLLYAGTGKMLEELRAEAESYAPGRVHFAGFLNQSEIPTAYRAADLLVMPSDHEPWGLVVNEAMNFEVPAIVSTQVGCGPDLVSPGVTGEVFNAGNEEHLSSMLAPLLHDPGRLGVMGKQARARIDEWSFKECEAGLRRALEKVGVRA